MQSAALSSTTQHAILPETGRKRGTVCLNTRFPLPTLLFCVQREANLFIFYKFHNIQREYLFRLEYNLLYSRHDYRF